MDRFLGALRFVATSEGADWIDKLHSFWTSNLLIAFAVLISWKQFGGHPLECMVPKMFPRGWEETFVGFLKFFGGNACDDYIDQLHYIFTCNILLACSIIVSFKQFGGKPVECMVPDMFPKPWEEYAEQYCWAQDTYYVPFDETVPLELEMRSAKKISYYQWVPFFLLFEAACFRLPSLLWKYLAGHSGIQIHDIVKIATDPENVKPQSKECNLKALTVHLQNALRFHRRLLKRNIKPHKLLCFLNLPYSTIYVTFIYLFVKSLFLLNVILQLYMMNRFLETNGYTLYGFGALSDMLNGTEVRVMGNNVQLYSVQCVLVINIFNEKIFIFLWFWFCLLCLLTTASLIYWLGVALFPCSPRSFISRHLELSEMPFDPRGSKGDVDRFVSGYLRTDGVFVLRMITMHSGIIFGTDLVLALWRAFYGIEESFRKQSVCQPPDRSNSLKDPKLSLNESGDHDDSGTSFGNLLRLRFGGKKARRESEARDFANRRQSEKELLEILLPNGERAFVYRKDQERSPSLVTPPPLLPKPPVRFFEQHQTSVEVEPSTGGGKLSSV